jgi:hypothetical protein
MIAKPPFLPVFLGVLTVVTVIFIIVTPVNIGCGPWRVGKFFGSHEQSLVGVPPNPRLKLPTPAQVR